MVVMATDGSLQPDALEVDITSPDGKTTYRSATYEIPAETTLPTSLTLESTSGSVSSASITVSVWAGGVPLDVRQDRVIQIPSDHLAVLDIVFSAKCTPEVSLIDGMAVSQCFVGETCDPTLGSCVTDVVSFGSDGGAPGNVSPGIDAGDTNTRDSEAEGASADATDEAAGACVPGATRCFFNGLETCVGGMWSPVVVDCPAAAPACTAGACGQPPSCQTSTPGTANCGGGSCCASPEVTSGTYYRTYTNAGNGPIDEANPASVSRFRLDTYDVTVGRFRAFVGAWNDGWTPSAGSGKHASLNGGLGLAGSGSPGAYEPGWLTSDDANVTPTNGNLACGGVFATWTPSPGGGENLPMNCVNWWEAYAFCIWDGGFLPTEAESDYAAAGGNQQREYPWGETDPGAMNQYAIYGCYYPSGSGTCTGLGNIAPVGTATLGAGLWGQLDLTGDVWPWTLDWLALYVDPCTDCVQLTPAPNRTHGGADYHDPASYLLTSARHGNPPLYRDPVIGFRCARSP
jgi:sulfatase modifying factor 1